jgi:hypothetical protein
MWDILGLITAITASVGVLLLASWLLNRHYHLNRR